MTQPLTKPLHRVVVHVAIGLPDATQTEVIGPADQHPVEPMHLRGLVKPGPLSAGQPTDITTQSPTLLLRWTRADVRTPRAIGVASADGVAQKITRVVRNPAYRRLLLVHRQFELLHHGSHDGHRFLSPAATAHHEVLSKIDDVRAKTSLVAQNLPPQDEPSPIEVGE